MLCIWDIWVSLSPRARHTDTDGEKRDGRTHERYSYRTNHWGLLRYGAKRARPLNVSFLFPSLFSFLLGRRGETGKVPVYSTGIGSSSSIWRVFVPGAITSTVRPFPLLASQITRSLSTERPPFHLSSALAKELPLIALLFAPASPFFLSFIVLYTRCAYCLSSISSILFAASGRVLDNTSASCLSFTGSCILAHSLLCLHFSAISPAFLSPGAYPLIRTT